MKKWGFVILMLSLCGYISSAQASMIWHIEKVDKGEWNNIVLDNNGFPHISYYSNKALKYATKIGITWVIETVDSMGDVGDYNSIKLDREGRPHISYYDVTNGNLKYAKKDSAWIIEKVDTIGDVGLYSSLFLDSQYRPCIAYCDSTQRALKYAKKEGEMWEIQIVDTTDTLLISYSSLAVDMWDNPHIAYVKPCFRYDWWHPSLEYAYWNAGNWRIETADSGISTMEWMEKVTLTLSHSNISYISYSAGGTMATGWSSATCIVRDSSGWQNIWEEWWTQTLFDWNISMALSQTNDSVLVHLIGSVVGYFPEPPHTRYIRIGESDTIEETVDSAEYYIYPGCLVLDSLNYPHFTFRGVHYGYAEDIGVEETGYRSQFAGCKLQVEPNPFVQLTTIRYWILETKQRHSK